MLIGTQCTWKRLQSLFRRSAAPIFGNLLDNVKLAADMGAEVVCLKSPDVIKALIKFAQDKKITLILVGQTHPGLWNRIFRRSAYQPAACRSSVISTSRSSPRRR